MTKDQEVNKLLGVTHQDDALYQIYQLNNTKNKLEIDIQELEKVRNRLQFSVPKNPNPTDGVIFDSSVLKLKQKEYQERLGPLQEILDLKVRFDQFLETQRRYQEFQENQRILDQLPPDITLARLELEKLKLKLQQKIELRANLMKQ
jgi:hypothetical protein